MMTMRRWLVIGIIAAGCGGGAGARVFTVAGGETLARPGPIPVAQGTAVVVRTEWQGACHGGHSPNLIERYEGADGTSPTCDAIPHTVEVSCHGCRVESADADRPLDRHELHVVPTVDVGGTFSATVVLDRGSATARRTTPVMRVTRPEIELRCADPRGAALPCDAVPFDAEPTATFTASAIVGELAVNGRRTSVGVPVRLAELIERAVDRQLVDDSVLPAGTFPIVVQLGGGPPVVTFRVTIVGAPAPDQ